ncbi:MAG: tetratricopeptide repeat protein [Desulfomonile tiedjei]|uniref:Tetratricopeptide repeat protein n=1 Tax=Desulfomonile tiedjei TaxID=2358 RepID=A0A9D6Z3F0_9BACT|nr:tetratricopeptide repeat protein [Desulfomonile tiedjei]
MDAVTYPNQAVTQFVQNNLIAVRVRNDQPLADLFKVKWTPTLVLVDPEGKEVYRNVGFLPPDNLVPALMLGIGKLELQHGNYDKAIPHFDRVASKFPQSEEAPEAIYFMGVSRFKMNSDLKMMKETYNRLEATYPNSSWTRKAQPYGSVK